MHEAVAHQGSPTCEYDLRRGGSRWSCLLHASSKARAHSSTTGCSHGSKRPSLELLASGLPFIFRQTCKWANVRRWNAAPRGSTGDPGGGPPASRVGDGVRTNASAGPPRHSTASVRVGVEALAHRSPPPAPFPSCPGGGAPGIRPRRRPPHMEDARPARGNGDARRTAYRE